MIELDEKKRIIQEFVPGKQVTLAHVIANPTEDLYLKISRHAIEAAETLKAALREKGYRFFLESPTNQIFVVLDNAQLKALEGKAKFGFWEKFDDTHTVVRIATSWATRMEEIQQLIELL